jgi:curli biogenesis system outer membrane secretion channel CsgG
MERKKCEEVLKEKKINRKRREVLKKALYQAPTLLVLGSLTKPTHAEASDLGGGGGWGDFFDDIFDNLFGKKVDNGDNFGSEWEK